MVIEKAGRVVETTEEGFLVDLLDWDEAVAVQLAAAEGIELDAARWEIVHFVRKHYLAHGHFPNMRVFVKAVAQVLGEEKGNSRYLHRLFPRGPLKYACKLAGLPKPPHCL